mmetsp:Transcript_22747/g.40655  ORF Transcript_22747/g.40655 Transcript_22747/m.40655 type:complete len:316 (-) Transcript_22747:350-1297(-)
MRQGQSCHTSHVLFCDLSVVLESCKSARGTVCDHVSAQTVDVQPGADRRDLHGQLPWHLGGFQSVTSLEDQSLQGFVLLTELLLEFLGSAGPIRRTLNDLHPPLRVVRSLDGDGKSEAIQELRPELALLGVAAADKDELGWVSDADALAFDRVPAAGSAVKQDVDQVIVQEVHLVHVEDAAVRLRKEPGLEGLLALGQCLLDVDRATDAVFCCSQGQVDHWHFLQHNGELLPRSLPCPCLFAHHVFLNWRRVVRIVGHAFNQWQEVDEGTDCGCLASATVAHDHHTSNFWVDHVQDQRELHLRLSHDGREWEHWP